MPSIDWYLDRARERAGLSSDRELGRRLELSGGAVNQWRTKRYWPDDESMLAIAELAGVEPARALLDLNSWRAKGERVRAVYLDLAAKAFVLIACVFVSNNNAQAANLQENRLADICPSLYIMRDLGRRTGHSFIPNPAKPRGFQALSGDDR